MGGAINEDSLKQAKSKMKREVCVHLYYFIGDDYIYIKCLTASSTAHWLA